MIIPMLPHQKRFVVTAITHDRTDTFVVYAHSEFDAANKVKGFERDYAIEAIAYNLEDMPVDEIKDAHDGVFDGVFLLRSGRYYNCRLE